jgi:hypothetical protein
MGWFDLGKKDAQSGKGQISPAKLPNDTATKNYQSAWNREREEQLKRQQENKGK